MPYNAISNTKDVKNCTKDMQQFFSEYIKFGFFQCHTLPYCEAMKSYTEYLQYPVFTSLFRKPLLDFKNKYFTKMQNLK